MVLVIHFRHNIYYLIEGHIGKYHNENLIYSLVNRRKIQEEDIKIKEKALRQRIGLVRPPCAETDRWFVERDT